MRRFHRASGPDTQEENGHRREGNAQGVVKWIVVFTVAAIGTRVRAKYLFDWDTGNLITENNGEEVVGGVWWA